MRLSEAYYERNPAASKLLGGSFLDESTRSAKSEAASKRKIAPGVVELLMKQNAAAFSGPGAEELKRKLGSPELQVVITGQQTGLFLGPLFTLYKALGAIKYAEELESESGRPTVAVFWVQSEDHDYDEVRTCPVLLPNGALSELALPEEPQEDRRKSMSARTLDSSVSTLVETVKEAFSTFPDSAWFSALLEGSYEPGATLNGAFTSLLSSLTAERGLLLFDPCIGGGKQLSRELYLKFFEQHAQITEMLKAQGRAIEQSGYEQQVYVRESSPLFFFHDGGPNAARYRLENGGDEWTLVGADKSISADKIRTLLDGSPEQFSSSALLRPLLQDYLFPTVAYIGGDAEVNYSAQTTPLYEFLGIPKPLIIPRPKFVVLEEKTSRLLEKTGLKPEDLRMPDAELLSKAASNPDARYVDPEKLFSEASAKISQISSSLEEELTKADKTLENPVQKTQEKMQHLLDVLKQRYIKAVSANDTLLQDRLRKLRTAIAPDGGEQERLVSSVYFLARYGKPFIQTIYDAIEPFSTDSKVVKI